MTTEVGQQDSSHRMLGDSFTRLASWSADILGSPSAFVVSTLFTLLWAISGPFFNYSDTWQLVINTATTVLTFLAVFLIQHTQNREGRAVQLKLDELIRTSKAARNKLINLENCSDAELNKLQEEFKRRRLQPDSVALIRRAAPGKVMRRKRCGS